ncbi:MAG: protein disulfide isomerase family protein [Patescibacteria group bacterium]
MSKKTKTITIIIAVFTVGFLAVLWAGSRSSGPTPDLTAFAECLREKNVIMYGAAWCPHCQEQKQLFGEAFKNLSYVECPENPQRCIAAGIEGYPTWVMSNGEKLVGEQKLESLAAATGCLLPFSK